LILDKQRVLRNIERMVRRAEEANVRFRPHFKTHQSAEIGEWFRAAGVSAITVSSFEMAVYFAKHGWSDITVAFPLNVLERQRVMSLSRSISLSILLDSANPLDVLNEAAEERISVWIKIDAGYGRVGLPWNATDQIVHLAGRIAESPNLSFAGILAHNGHSYYAKNRDEIQRIHYEALDRLTAVKTALQSKGHSRCEISIGDTPSCSTVSSFEGIDEIRPGNFVFYDVMQALLGACEENDIAVVVLCPVVGIYTKRFCVAIYGGAVHLSKESITLPPDGQRVFGFAGSGEHELLGRFDRAAPLVNLTQEHGIVELPESRLTTMRIGALLPVFPIHSCLTANLYGQYLTLDGDTIYRMPKR
jgi:D-serine deaminase-like pyridoxal phosphate-dependent protein